MLSLPLWLQMLSCLEYMYHDLGLVKEFNMNPITLKRWLVKLQKRVETSHMFSNVHFTVYKYFFLSCSWPFRRTTETTLSTTSVTASALVR